MPNDHTSVQIAAPLGGPRVVVLAYDGLCTFEFGVAHEVFGLDRPEMGTDWYQFSVAAAEPGRLRAAGGLVVEPEADLSLLSSADLIVIPGWRSRDAAVPPDLIAALKGAHARGARLASLCSGIFVIAATGLLDGRAGTTHWRYAGSMAARYPHIRLMPDVLYVDNGDILTAAGSAAGIDLCLHIVRKDFGAEAANRVARRLIVPPHRDGGQAQFIEQPVPLAYEGQRLGALVDWMLQNLGSDMPLPVLARRAGMSLRTFQRRFEKLTGKPPGAWIMRERVNLARRILETAPSTAMEDVSRKAGFADAGAMRHHFRKHLGTTPTAYQRRFAA
jgi:AraC family transcriptional regulator, transcriptional activator FtrA